jgi:hypothetical protein
MSILDKITLKQYVELAKELKERYEYLNVEQTSASLFAKLFPTSSTSSNAYTSRSPESL